MSIICATDFSPLAEAAAREAAGWAVRLDQPLILAHVIPTAPAFPVEIGDTAFTFERGLREAARRALTKATQALAVPGLTVEPRLLEGSPAEELAALAEATAARMIVVGTHGRKPAARLFLGSVSERVVRTVSCPALVVTEAAAVAKVASPASKPLTIVAGLDETVASEAAVDWLRALRDQVPCDIIFVHAFWPPREQERLGLESDGQGGSEALAEATEIIRRDFAPRLAGFRGAGTLTLEVRPTLGSHPDPLAWEAAARGADLLVVGTSQRRHGWTSGSTAIATLRAATVPVLCVPRARSVRRDGDVHLSPVRQVLAPTDLSDLGNHAVSRAYQLLAGAGGMVELCHVVENGGAAISADAHARIEAALAALIPEDAPARHIATRITIVASDSPGRAILQTADRLGVQAIVLGTHGRSGLRRLLVGTVADSVVRGSHRPVVLVPPPAKD